MRHINFSLSGTVDPIITAAGTVLVGKAPADANGGGMTVLEAYGFANVGTASVVLIDLGASGTVVTGTIATIAFAAAGSQAKGTATVGYWLDGGNYVGMVTAAGTIKMPVNFSLLVTPGR